MISLILSYQISINEYNCSLLFPYLLVGCFLGTSGFGGFFQDPGLLNSIFISFIELWLFVHFLAVFRSIIGSCSLLAAMLELTHSISIIIFVLWSVFISYWIKIWQGHTVLCLMGNLISHGCYYEVWCIISIKALYNFNINIFWLCYFEDV